jgi:hypothetical protein
LPGLPIRARYGPEKDYGGCPLPAHLSSLSSPSHPASKNVSGILPGLLLSFRQQSLSPKTAADYNATGNAIHLPDCIKRKFYPAIFSVPKKTLPDFSRKNFLTQKCSLKNHYKKFSEYSYGFPEKSGSSRAGTNNFHREYYR